MDVQAQDVVAVVVVVAEEIDNGNLKSSNPFFFRRNIYIYQVSCWSKQYMHIVGVQNVYLKIYN